MEILPHLVLGCEKDSANLALLRQMGITAVLNVSSNCPNHFEELFEYMTIRVEDSYQADLLSRLHSAFSFIGEYVILLIYPALPYDIKNTYKLHCPL